MPVSAAVLAGVQWTRTLVLILAIIIVAASLSIYSSHTIPIFSLFAHHSRHDDMAARESTILLEMIQDRRLISTLVAAQASVFCPLFLLLTSSRKQEEQELHSSHVAVDLLCCNVLMPFGLALSWIFCILFDRKTMAAMSTAHGYLDMCLGNGWTCGVVNGIHGLKYLIVLVLLLEIELVIVGSVLARYSRISIQLEELDEKTASFMDEQQRTAILHQQV